MQAFQIGSTVEVLSGSHEGEQGEITRIAFGWVTVLLEDGDEHKFRPAALQVQEDEEPEEVEFDASMLEADEAEQDDGEVEAGSLLARQMAKYRGGYQNATNATGGSTKICGDQISQWLLGYTPAGVCMLADVLLGQPDGFHAERYASLNNGQVRMNAGNRIRAFLKANPGAAPESLLKFMDNQQRAA